MKYTIDVSKINDMGFYYEIEDKPGIYQCMGFSILRDRDFGSLAADPQTFLYRQVFAGEVSEVKVDKYIEFEDWDDEELDPHPQDFFFRAKTVRRMPEIGWGVTDTETVYRIWRGAVTPIV